jgi:hypothetical protein
MGKVWVESMWLTHRESITLGEEESNETITRDFSAGMTIKSDGTVKSDEMYTALKRALNVIVEEEKETWLDSHHMKRETADLKRKLLAPDDTGVEDEPVKNKEKDDGEPIKEEEEDDEGDKGEGEGEGTPPGDNTTTDQGSG